VDKSGWQETLREMGEAVFSETWLPSGNGSNGQFMGGT